MSEKKKDIITSICVIAIGVIVIAMSSGLKKVAATFPVVFASILIILGTILLLTALLKKPAKKVKDEDDAAEESVMGEKETAEPKKQPKSLYVLILLGIMIIYYILFRLVGFIIPTILLIFTTSYVLGYKNHLINAVFSVGLTMALYLLVTLLFKVRF